MKPENQSNFVLLNKNILLQTLMQSENAEDTQINREDKDPTHVWIFF